MKALLLLCCLTAATALEPLAVRDGAFVTPGGEPVGLFGVNLFQSHLRWARLQRAGEMAEAFEALAPFEFNLVRFPLSAGFLMPAPGVLPDDPRYAGELSKYGLDAGYPALLDQLVAEAGRKGVWCLLELHEFPDDPYRWFTGGEESKRGTAEPGQGMKWAADETEVRRQTPAIVGWLAARYRGNPNVAGIEVPYNEPHGTAEFVRGDGYKQFVADCGRAVKASDPERLVFMNVGDWGAGVNALDDSWVWDLPPEVDALAPHFYLGMHNASARVEDAYGVVPASWLSWFRGSGKPVLVGEYGPAHVAHPEHQTYDAGPHRVQRLHDACLAGWYRNGAQGAARWAWDGGIGEGEIKSGLIEGESIELLKYRRPFQLRPVTGRGQVAVVLDPARRASYGQPADLLKIAAALLDAGIAPFDCLFEQQVVAQPEVLREYPGLLVYQPDLDPAALEAVRAAYVPRLELADDTVDAAALRAWLREVGLHPDAAPIAVWAFDTPGHLTLFNRTAESAAYAVPVPEDRRLIDRLRGEVMPGNGRHVRVDLARWTGRELVLLPADEPLPAPLRVDGGRPRASDKLPLVIGLYDHGPIRGRWVAGWAGGQALLRRDIEGREVIAVATDERQEAGGFNLNQHQPAELRSWRRADGAAIELKVRLTSRNVAAVEVELHGEDGTAVANAALRPGTEWQRLKLPLDRFTPAARPSLLTGVYLRFLPAGSGEIGGAWLTRSPDRGPG